MSEPDIVASSVEPVGARRRARFPFSLRSRLLAGLVVLSAIGLTVAAYATHALLASFLLKQFDSQQVGASRFVESVVFPPSGAFGRPGVGGGFRRGENNRLLPTGTYAAAVDADGHVVQQYVYNATDIWAAPSAADVPKLPADVAARTTSFTARDKDGAAYRVVVDHDPGSQLADQVSGATYTFVLAMPLRDVDQTLSRLWVLEGAVTGAVLVGIGLLAWFVVGVGLRPLRRMEISAGAIATGDLSKRIEHPDARTEIGRLGLALNTMLARIEDAFAARAASETRLRQFLADASHELRTPLTSIRGYAELFRRGASNRPDDLEKAMRRIEDESARMSVLVDELLLLARLDQGRAPVREPVLLAELAVDACDDLRTADPSRAVRLDADPDVVVEGDEMRLRQVIGNLLANARVHTPAGTAVDVRVAAEGDLAVLEVTDHGRGLPPEDLPRVFDRFYRADQSRARDHGGAGLGLAIVAAVVQSHGGRVGVLNVPPAGARFRVELPLLRDVDNQLESADGAPTAAPDSPARVNSEPATPVDTELAANSQDDDSVVPGALPTLEHRVREGRHG